MRERPARFRACPGDNGGARMADCGREELDRCGIAPRALCGQRGAARKVAITLAKPELAPWPALGFTGVHWVHVAPDELGR